jgi:hydroxymethylpyrimidine pyrophosphatase-like HAD family hydrolase
MREAIRHMPDPILITTDLDRTLVFSRRATSQLGGELPADAVELTGGQTAGELSRAARDAIAALPGHVLLCLATSRSLTRLSRLRLPFAAEYAIANNGGIILADGRPDLEWAAAVRRDIAAAAPAEQVRAVFEHHDDSGWLERMGEPDDMCCMAVVDPARLPAEQFARISASCENLGWQASLTGRKMYAFPDGIGKERAAAFVARRVAATVGVAPLRLAAGDTEHDREMLEAADRAWVPAGSELAASCDGRFRVTRLPGHSAAAQITREWLEASLR